MTLLKGDTTDLLRCRIDHVRLQKDARPSKDGPADRLVWLALNYNALSYVWGSPNTTEDLVCDSKVIKITENLSSALKHVRSPEVDKPLWVDQICINQGDSKERSRQVHIMDDVYRNAAMVISWLGDDPEGHRFAFKEFLADMHLGKDQMPDVDCFIRNHLPTGESPKWKALDTMMALPYFTRVWIMQEVVLARDVMVLWGDINFSFSYVRGFTRAAVSALKRDRYSGSQLSDANIHRVLSITSLPQECRFEDVIYRVTHRESTDKRDRIYAILGLIKDGPDVLPDYQKSEREVFQDVILQIIKLRQNLMVLSSVFHHNEKTLEPLVWSTWVPHWDTASPAAITDFCEKFRACGSASFRLPVHSHDRASIEVQGLQIASINFAGFVNFDKTDPRQWHIDTVQQIWDAWGLATGHESVAARYGSSLIQAFIWTLLCGWPESEENDEVKDMWAESQIYRDFAAFWADHLSRQCRYVLSEEADPISFISERITLAEITVLKGKDSYQKVLSGTSTDDPIHQTREAGMRSNPDPTNCERFKTGLCEKMSQKYNQFKSVTISDKLAYFYPEGDWQKFDRMWSTSGHHRRFFVLSNGQIGMGPLVMRKGDIVAVLLGGTVPYVLRPTPDGYMFLGECYVHGIMYGESINQLSKVTFQLI